MKKIIYVICCLCILSCTNSKHNSENRELQEKISKLESENKVLKDSISKAEEDFLLSQILLGIPENPVLKVGEKSDVSIIFHTYNRKIPKSDIYKIEGDTKIKIGSNDSTKFNYEFTANKIGLNKLNLLVKIPFKNRVIEIPAGMYFKGVK